MFADLVYSLQTGFNCAVPLYLALMAILFGIVALAWGTVAWDLPLPAMLRSAILALGPAAIDKTGNSRAVVRFLAPFNGCAFLLVGLYIVWGKMHCGTLSIVIPNIAGSIAFSNWPGVYVATILAASLTLWNTRDQENLARRLLTTVGMALIGFAAGEAAGLHTGVHATQWGVAALLGFACIQLIAWGIGAFRNTNSGDGA